MGREGQDPLTQLIPLERVTTLETTCPTQLENTCPTQQGITCPTQLETTCPTQLETTCPTPPVTRWDTILVQLGPQQRVTEVPRNTAWRDIMVLRKITWGDIMMEPLVMKWG